MADKTYYWKKDLGDAKEIFIARGKARMNPVFAGDLSRRLVTLYFSHY